MPDTEDMITLNVFNLLVQEMSPGFLEKGIWITKERAEAFCRENAQILQHCLRDFRKDQKEISPEQPGSITWTADPVFIRGEILPS